MKGDNSPSINNDNITSFLFPIPPLAEQRRIVSVIESAFALIDEIEDNKASLQQLIKHAKAKTLDLAIRGKLVPQEKNATTIKTTADNSPYPFEVPEGWEWCRLGDVSQHNTGKTLDKGRNTGIMRKYITTSNLYWGSFDFTEVREMPFEEKGIERFTAEKGDLLICEGGDAGRSAVWNEDYPICFQNHVHRVRLYGNVNTYYTFYYMMYLSLSKNLDYYKKGVAIQSLSGQALSSIIIPLPPLAEQHRIVARIEQIFAQLDEIETALTTK